MSSTPPDPRTGKHQKPTALPPALARLPTFLDSIPTPPLAKPQNLADAITVSMSAVPHTVSEAAVSSADIVVTGVKNALPFDVEMFRDIATLLLAVLSRNAHEMPPLDIGELLLCIGMYCHYQLQKKLDEDGSGDSEDLFSDSPRVTEREPYERFLYSIDYAEAAYASDVDGILERCKCIRSRDWIKDLVHESTPDCPAFFLAVDPDNWKIIVAIRGTASLHDAIVDLKMDCEPFLGGYAHQGMAHLAHKLLDRILPQLQYLRRVHPNFQLLITGHSLGAGIASLFTLLLSSPPHKENFPSVRGVCFATPACCTQDLTDRAAQVVDSLVLGYDVVPALSEKSLIWLLRELQKFSKDNQHRQLLSEAWRKQMDDIYETLKSNSRTQFLVSAWESQPVASVRDSVGTIANVAAGAITVVTNTAQETAIHVVEAAVALPFPAPTFLQRWRRRIVDWLVDLRKDMGQTSTLLTVTLTYTSRVIFQRRSLRYTLGYAACAVLGQVSYMRWKQHTAQKLEADLAGERKSSSDEEGDKRGDSAATAKVTGSEGDGTAPYDEGELKVLLTPATLYYLREWVEDSEESSSAAGGHDPGSIVQGEDLVEAINDNASTSGPSEPLSSEGERTRQHVLLQAMPTHFTKIAVNVRMIDDHLLGSYRRALQAVIWDDIII